MNEKNYKYLLYLISAVIAITLAIQVYWNYKNYKESERELRIDLQTTLDQSVEDYFTLEAKNNRLNFFNNDDQSFTISKVLETIDFENLDENDELILPEVTEIEGLTILSGVNGDSLKYVTRRKKSKKAEDFFKAMNDSISSLKDSTITDIRITNLKFSDEKGTTEIQELTDRIVFSIKSTKIDPKKLDSLFLENLKIKDIQVPYNMVYHNFETPIKNVEAKEDWASFDIRDLMTRREHAVLAQSELISDNQQLGIEYTGLSGTILKRNLTGILLSTLLIASVILCLFYLLNIINRQKNLNTMKNDLISNITHEFKTPIATTTAALEGVQNFTNSGDTEKTHRYLTMGREQLSKLNNMVEKLLETASLDGEELDLQKDETNLNDIIASLVTKFQPQTSKTIDFKNHSSNSHFMGDGFHLENAINNLIDNAIKYGGDVITIELFKTAEQFELLVSDSGTGLRSKDAKNIFNQFYRVPKGNLHDVKGFGIGLYYTKSIIEKHNGSISVTTKPYTQFKIVLPYA